MFVFQLSVPPKSMSSQRGVALITVLLVFAIASVVVSKILLNNAIDVKRSSGLFDRTQAYYYALGGEEGAIRMLQVDSEYDRSQGTADHLNELWTAPTPMELDNIGNVHVLIIDLNRFFNVNLLVDQQGEIVADQVERFRELLNKLFIDDELADNLADWLDADDKAKGVDSESEYYERLDIPYLAANSQMTDISELLLVKGFNRDIYTKLLPYVTAIKLSSNVNYNLNINTAPPMVLGTLRSSNAANSSFLSESEAEAISDSAQFPFNDINKFINDPVSGQINSAAGLTVQSQIYEINVRAEYAGSVVYLTTVVAEGDLLPNGRTKYLVLSRNETDNSARFIYNQLKP